MVTANEILARGGASPAVTKGACDGTWDCGLQPAGRDFLISWLLTAKPGQVAAVIAGAMIVGLLPVMLAKMEGNLVNSGLALDLSHDYLYFAWLPFGLPIIIGLLVMVFRRLPVVCWHILSSIELGLTAKETEEALSRARKRFGSWWMAIAPVAAGVTIASFNYLSFVANAPESTWQVMRDGTVRNATAAGLADKLLVAVLFYFVLAVFLRLVVAYFVVRNLFAVPAVLDPFHPDGCGGLSPLGGLALRLNGGVLFFGVVTVAAVLTIGFGPQSQNSVSQPLIAGSLFIYSTAAFLLIAFPMLPAQESLRRARDREMMLLGRRSKVITAELNTSLEAGGGIDSSLVEEMARTEMMYQQVKKLPLIPFDSRTIAGVVSGYLLPFVGLLIPGIIERVFSQFLG